MSPSSRGVPSARARSPAAARRSGHQDQLVEPGVAIRPRGDAVDGDPARPNCRLSVFSQPVSAGRNMFESARCVVGSWAASEVVATMRPAGLAAGEGEAASVTARSAGQAMVKLDQRLVGRSRGRTAGRRRRAVADEDVEAAESLNRGREQPLFEVGVAVSVAGDVDTPEPHRRARRAAAARRRRGRRWLPPRPAPRRSRARGPTRRRRRAPCARFSHP